MEDPLKLLTEAEAAEILGISQDTLFRTRRAGRISHVVVGNRGVRYTPACLRDFVERSTTQCEPQNESKRHSGSVRSRSSGLPEIHGRETYSSAGMTVPQDSDALVQLAQRTFAKRK